MLSHFLGVVDTNECDFLRFFWVLLPRNTIFFEESAEVDRVNKPILVALRSDEFSVARPNSRAKLKGALV